MIATGTKLGGYRVERLLGSGGMGTVYLATQESLNRPVALKLLNPSLTSDETFRARFRREGEVQAALDHPHIVPVYEAGESDEGLFLAMRFVRGSTLKDLVDAGELDAARTLRLLTPVASALDAAHAAGLIHRDVKPQNILVDQTDWPYLADFGLTRGGAGGPTRTGQLVGPFAYVAPEQVQGHKASARSDQYALAAVLFECLAGQVPHNQDSDAALLYAKVHQEPPRLSARAADLPTGLDDVLARGMARDPDERFPSASALLAAAAEALERGDEPAPAPAPPPPRVQPDAPAPPPDPPPSRAQPDVPPARSARTRDTVLVDAPAAIPAEAPAPPAAPKRARSPKPRVALGAPRFVRDPRAVALVALAAAALGVLAGTAVGGGEEQAATKAAAGELGTFAVPAGMRPARGPAGLGLDELQVYAQGSTRTLAVGTGSPAGRKLLPAGALADAAGAAEPAVVRIGAVQALRFTGLRVRGLAGRTQLVSVPTSGGVLVAACAGPRAAESGCSTALGSLALRDGVDARPVAAPAAYAGGLRAALTAYERARSAATARLRSAGRASSQAAAARDLGSAAGALAGALAKLSAPPGAQAAHGTLTAAAGRLRAAAARLASAASQRSASRYRAAATSVESADRRLRRSIETLGKSYRTN